MISVNPLSMHKPIKKVLKTFSLKCLVNSLQPMYSSERVYSIQILDAFECTCNHDAKF